MDNKDLPIRKSKITKVVTRKFTTGVQFEMVDITVGFEEEISWKTQEERDIKSKAITKKLINDFNETKNEVFNGMKIVNSAVNNGKKEEFDLPDASNVVSNEEDVSDYKEKL